jgi:hypothetical protein
MKKTNTQSILLALVIAAFVIIISMLLTKGVNVEVLADSVKIEGLYGIEIPYSEIEEVKMLDSMPLWGLKTNGINLGFMNIGMFTYKELGSVRLFEIKKEKPYVMIVGKKGKIVLGLGREKNAEVYKAIEASFQTAH